jgi:predicted N-acetyltransferase YhbS
MIVRLEEENDVKDREQLLNAVMGPHRKRKSSEKLRRGRLPSDGLAFSGIGNDGRLIGTVRLWDIELDHDEDGIRKALLLGPLAVSCNHHGSGLGSQLMRTAIRSASLLGHGAIILAGDPSYYRRFGFSNELTDKIAMPGPFERERLLALELMVGHLSGCSGIIRPNGIYRRKTKSARSTSRVIALAS